MQDLWVGVFQGSAYLGQSLKRNTWSGVRHRHTTYYVPQPQSPILPSSVSRDPHPCQSSSSYNSSFSSSSFCFLFLLLSLVAEACWQPLSPCLWMSAAKEIGAGLMKLAVETLLPKPKPPKAVVPLRSKKKKEQAQQNAQGLCNATTLPCHCQDIATSLPCHSQVVMSLAYCHVVAMVSSIAHCDCGVIAMLPRTRIITPAAGPCPKATSAAVERAPSPERPIKHATAAPSALLLAATQGTVSQAQGSRSAGARAVPDLMAAALLTALRVTCHRHPCCSHHRRRCRRCRRHRRRQ